MTDRLVALLDGADAMLFDLDGVLVDSSASVAQHWPAWAVEHDLDPGAVVRAAHGRRTVETVTAFLGAEIDAELEAARLERHQAAEPSGTRAYAGASVLLNTTRKRVAIVTSGGRHLAGARLRYVGLPVPDVMVTGDDVVLGKPEPEGYLAGAAALGVAPERCIVVEDAPAGIGAGDAAGMPVVAVQSTHEPSALRGATIVLPSLEPLATAVAG